MKLNKLAKTIMDQQKVLNKLAGFEEDPTKFDLYEKVKKELKEAVEVLIRKFELQYKSFNSTEQFIKRLISNLQNTTDKLVAHCKISKFGKELFEAFEQEDENYNEFYTDTVKKLLEEEEEFASVYDAEPDLS